MFDFYKPSFPAFRPEEEGRELSGEKAKPKVIILFLSNPSPQPFPQWEREKIKPLLASRVDPQRPHAAIQVAAIDAHQLGCARNVAAGFIEFALNEFAMIGIAGFFE